jgi:hypothetical protein
MRILTYATLALLALHGVAVIVEGLTLFGRLQVLSELASASSRRAGLLGAARASDAQVRVASVFLLVTLVLAYICSGVWIYNAACNVRALGARGLQNSPGWAVGWYAVPFAALFKPFQAMEEIFKASVAPLGWVRQRMPLLLPAWWAVWLLMGFARSLGLMMARAAKGLLELSVTTAYRLAEYGLELICTGLFITIVVRIYRAQVRARSAATDVAEVFA